MGLAGDYVAAIRDIGKVVEGIFDRISPYCRFYEKDNDPSISVGECYYCGREKAHVCAREICPLLQVEKLREP